MNRDPQAWARLGRALREARERRGLTQADVAARADVSILSVQSAEKGAVPKARMPYTLARIAAVYDWPAGSVEAVLDGAEPPGGWSQQTVQIPADLISGVMSHAMVRATDNATASEIRAAVNIALDELRRAGLVSGTDDTQPTDSMHNQ